MDKYYLYKNASGKDQLDVPLRGYELIRQPLLNKGSAFTPQERSELGLEGLIPTRHNSMEQQATRAYASLSNLAEPLEKYVALSALQDRNEILYYKVLQDHIEELMPIVYTPTVGLATQKFSEVFQRGRGVWITPDFRGHIAKTLRRAAHFKDVKLIVVTDNESILGIGDQGAGGMAISIGKLSLYCIGAGIHPADTLPISLDVGTNNLALLDDDSYLGWRQPRLQGAEYNALLEEFVDAVKAVFPGALLQWEDFRKNNALEINQRYRHSLPSFNDDIQGTGAVALAGVLSASRITGRLMTEQRVLILGAGAAGLGIANQLLAAFADAGLTGDALTYSIAVLDSRGLLVDDRDLGDDYKKSLAWSKTMATAAGLSDTSNRGLATTVAAYKPTVLIGASGQAGAFTKEIISSMLSNTPRPVIMPFSNPTDHCEGIPRLLIEWCDGECLIATGSPFADVTYKHKTHRIAQGNNVFIFPGLGLGTLLCNASEISDGMINASAEALANSVNQTELSSGMLFPDVTRLGEVSSQVAAAVIRCAIEEKRCEPLEEHEIAELISNNIWTPNYADYIAV